MQERRVRQLATVEVEPLEVGQRGEVADALVGHAAVEEGEGGEEGQGRQRLQPPVGDGRVCQVELGEPFQALQRGQPCVACVWVWVDGMGACNLNDKRIRPHIAINQISEGV
jgi:hypothetical protein